ncbi:High frequency lysogenization protein HflD homolog [Gammaproteobacteria bacterium]
MSANRNTDVMRDRILALAGLLQATFLVQQIARQGTVMGEAEAFRSSIESIFVTDADTVEEVYGGVAGLALGLRLLRYHLAGTSEIPTTSSDRERIRYFFSIIRLERQLQSHSAMLTRIGAGIELARNQARHLAVTHPDIVASLATLYTETISTLDFRILVSGEQVHLSRAENANGVRALLLAGVRSAVLLYQRGWRRWMLLFQRRALLDTTVKLLESLEESPH